MRSAPMQSTRSGGWSGETQRVNAMWKAVTDARTRAELFRARHLGGACTTHGGRLMAPSRGRDHAQRPGQRDRVGQRGGRAQREVVAGPRDDHDANVCLGGVEP